MESTFSIWIKTHKVYSAIAFYLLAFLLIAIANRLDPTSLAGPGLDWFVLVITLVWSIVLLARCFIKVVKKNKAYIAPLIVHSIFWIAFVTCYCILEAINKS